MAARNDSMDLPVIDLDIFLNNPQSSPEVQAECKRAADALITYGALVLHDSRVAEKDNRTSWTCWRIILHSPRRNCGRMSGPS